MPSVTGANLLQQVREAIGSENDKYIKDPEVYRILTQAVSDTWDRILMYGIGTEGVKSVNWNAIANQASYTLSGIVTGGDFYQVQQMYVVNPDGTKRQIERLNPSEQYFTKAPSSGATMLLTYFPTSPVFVTGTETFDGINGWEEHAVMGACQRIKAKKEDSTGEFVARKREIESRMKVMANRLQDSPPRVVRRMGRGGYYGMSGPPFRYGRYRGGYDIPYITQSVNYYDLRGGNVELYA